MALSKIEVPSLDVGQLGSRNIVINGDQKIWQRGTSTSSGSSEAYLVDRLFTYANYGTLNYTVAKSSDVPTGQGFGSSISITADQAIGSNLTNYVMHRYYVESQDVDHLAYGTVLAKKCTLSFWVKCPRTGNLTISFAHSGLGSQRQISRQISITAANTWQKVTALIPGDTVRAMNASGSNSSGMFWDIIFNVENNWKSASSINTDWNYNVTQSRAVGQTQFLQASGDACLLTGMQFEAGEATPFEHESYGTTLQKCQRYFYKVGGSGGYATIFPAYAPSTGELAMMSTFPVTMRTTPSVSWENNNNLTFRRAGNGSHDWSPNNVNALSLGELRAHGGAIWFGGFSHGQDTLGAGHVRVSNGSNHLRFDAEL